MPGARLRRTSVIPVYSGYTPEQSWAMIVNADGEPIAPEICQNIDGWVSIGTWENSEGDVYTAVMADDGSPEDLLNKSVEA